MDIWLPTTHNRKPTTPIPVLSATTKLAGRANSSSAGAEPSAAPYRKCPMEMPHRPLTADMRPDLRTLDRAGLEAFVRDLGEPAYRGRQIFRWIHARRAGSFDEMTDLPIALRQRLAGAARIGALEEVRRLTARDGTIKVLYRLPSGRDIESVLIP